MPSWRVKFFHFLVGDILFRRRKLMKGTVVVSIPRYDYLAKRIADLLDATYIEVKYSTFEGGERYYQIGAGAYPDSYFANKNVIIVGATWCDDALHDVYRLGCAFAEYGARRLIFVDPFFGYSTMERAAKPGEIVTAKTSARLLSAIPIAGIGNQFLLLDTHTSGIMHYFEGSCRRTHLSGESTIVDFLRGNLPREQIISGGEHYRPELSVHIASGQAVLASGDLGGAKQVGKLAKALGLEKLAFINKRRELGSTEVMNVIGEVEGKHVYLYDDMTRSAGTLIQAARAYMAHGATGITAILSHLALNDKSVVQMRLLTDDNPISRVVALNTCHQSEWSEICGSDLFMIIDVAPLFADMIRSSLS
jgi:ribose-phosphate pyrophosphokinase